MPMMEGVAVAAPTGFKLHCPKCRSRNVSVEKDPRTSFGATNAHLGLILTCHSCGKRLYGGQVLDERGRQEAEWEDNVKNGRTILPMTPYKAPPRALSLPSREEVSKSLRERVPVELVVDEDPFKLDPLPVATEVVTEVRTQLKCGEFGYWCHGTCQRNNKCMYKIRVVMAEPAEPVRCANERCDKNGTPTSKYCSKQCRDRQNGRNAYLRKKALSTGA